MVKQSESRGGMIPWQQGQGKEKRHDFANRRRHISKMNCAGAAASTVVVVEEYVQVKRASSFK